MVIGIMKSRPRSTQKSCWFVDSLTSSRIFRTTVILPNPINQERQTNMINTTKSKILEKLFVNYVNSNSDRIRALAKFCNLSQQEKSDLVVAFKKHQLTIKGESK